MSKHQQCAQWHQLCYCLVALHLAFTAAAGTQGQKATAANETVLAGETRWCLEAYWVPLPPELRCLQPSVEGLAFGCFAENQTLEAHLLVISQDSRRGTTDRRMRQLLEAAPAGGTTATAPPPGVGGDSLLPQPPNTSHARLDAGTASTGEHSGALGWARDDGLQASVGGAMRTYLAGRPQMHNISVHELGMDAFELQLLEGSGWAASGIAMAGFPLSPSVIHRLMASVAPLPQQLLSDPLLDWGDFVPFLREVAAVWDRSVVAVPFTAEVPMLFYRRDVFAQYNLTPPATWPDYYTIAHALHGRPMASADGGTQPIAGWCEAFPPGCSYDGLMLASIWVPFVSRLGEGHGVFFRPSDMQPRLDGAGMAEAVRLFRIMHEVKLQGHPPNCQRLDLSVILSRCALAPIMSTAFKRLAVGVDPAFFRGRLGLARLPGSELVEHPVTGVLVPCTDSLCPNAEEATLRYPAGLAIGGAGRSVGSLPSADTATVAAAQGGAAFPTLPARRALVNFAPFLGRAALALALNRSAPVHHQFAAWRALLAAVAPEALWASVLDPDVLSSPVRESHMDPDNIQRWVGAGYGEADARAYLLTLQALLAHPNAVMLPRIPGSEYLSRVLANASDLLQYQDVQDAAVVKVIAADLPKYINLQDPVLRQMYWQDIRYTPGADEPSSSTQRLSTAAIIGSVCGVVAALALLVAVAWRVGHARAWMRLGNRHGSVAVAAPSYGRDSTLVVTDIADSTKLWEQLPAGVMDVALNLHNDCVRQLLPRYNGYECGTEGDSFILAFVDAQRAVICCLHIQEALLALDWPPELLATELCRPVAALTAPTHRSPWSPVTSRQASRSQPPGRTSSLGSFAEAADGHEEEAEGMGPARDGSHRHRHQHQQQQQALDTEEAAMPVGTGSFRAQLAHMRSSLSLRSSNRNTPTFPFGWSTAGATADGMAAAPAAGVQQQQSVVQQLEPQQQQSAAQQQEHEQQQQHDDEVLSSAFLPLVGGLTTTMSITVGGAGAADRMTPGSCHDTGTELLVMGAGGSIPAPAAGVDSAAAVTGPPVIPLPLLLANSTGSSRHQRDANNRLTVVSEVDPGPEAMILADESLPPLDQGDEHGTSTGFSEHLIPTDSRPPSVPASRRPSPGRSLGAATTQQSAPLVAAPPSCSTELTSRLQASSGSQSVPFAGRSTAGGITAVSHLAASGSARSLLPLSRQGSIAAAMAVAAATEQRSVSGRLRSRSGHLMEPTVSSRLLGLPPHARMQAPSRLLSEIMPVGAAEDGLDEQRAADASLNLSPARHMLSLDRGPGTFQGQSRAVLPPPTHSVRRMLDGVAGSPTAAGTLSASSRAAAAWRHAATSVQLLQSGGAASSQAGTGANPGTAVGPLGSIEAGSTAPTHAPGLASVSKYPFASSFKPPSMRRGRGKAGTGSSEVFRDALLQLCHVQQTMLSRTSMRRHSHTVHGAAAALTAPGAHPHLQQLLHGPSGRSLGFARRSSLSGLSASAADTGEGGSSSEPHTARPSGTDTGQSSGGEGLAEAGRMAAATAVAAAAAAPRMAAGRPRVPPGRSFTNDSFDRLRAQASGAISLRTSRLSPASPPPLANAKFSAAVPAAAGEQQRQQQQQGPSGGQQDAAGLRGWLQNRHRSTRKSVVQTQDVAPVELADHLVRRAVSLTSAQAGHPLPVYLHRPLHPRQAGGDSLPLAMRPPSITRPSNLNAATHTHSTTAPGMASASPPSPLSPASLQQPAADMRPPLLWPSSAPHAAATASNVPATFAAAGDSALAPDALAAEAIAHVAAGLSASQDHDASGEHSPFNGPMLPPPPPLALNPKSLARRYSVETLWPAAFQNPAAACAQAYGPSGPSRFLAAEMSELNHTTQQHQHHSSTHAFAQAQPNHTAPHVPKQSSSEAAAAAGGPLLDSSATAHAQPAPAPRPPPAPRSPRWPLQPPHSVATPGDRNDAMAALSVMRSAVSMVQLRAGGAAKPPSFSFMQGRAGSGADLATSQSSSRKQGFHTTPRKGPQNSPKLPPAAALRGAGSSLLQRIMPSSTSRRISLNFASGTAPAPACFRGFRVRMGMCSGLVHGRDVAWTKRSGRTTYSGHCMQLAKLVSDAGVGGMVLLAADTWQLLQPWPEALSAIKALHFGRFCLLEKDVDPLEVQQAVAEGMVPRSSRSAAAAAATGSTATFPAGETTSGSQPHPSLQGTQRASNNSACMTDVYGVTTASLLMRLPHWEALPGGCCGLRSGVRVLPGVLEAPLGSVTFCKLSVIGLQLLYAWDTGVAAESQGLWELALVQQCSALGGYVASMAGGEALLVFREPLRALAFALGFQDALCRDVLWPEQLLQHELGEVLELGAKQLKGLRVRCAADLAAVRFDVGASTAAALYASQAAKAMKHLTRMLSAAHTGQLLCRGAVVAEVLSMAAQVAAAVAHADSATTSAAGQLHRRTTPASVSGVAPGQASFISQRSDSSTSVMQRSSFNFGSGGATGASAAAAAAAAAAHALGHAASAGVSAGPSVLDSQCAALGSSLLASGGAGAAAGAAQVRPLLATLLGLVFTPISIGDHGAKVKAASVAVTSAEAVSKVGVYLASLRSPLQPAAQHQHQQCQTPEAPAVPPAPPSAVAHAPGSSHRRTLQTH